MPVGAARRAPERCDFLTALVTVANGLYPPSPSPTSLVKDFSRSAMERVDVLSDGVGCALMNSPLGGPIRVYRTRDGGRSWTPVDGLWVKVPLQPPPSIGITAFFAPVVTDPQGGAATSASVGEGSQGVGAPESLYVYGKPARGGWLGPLKVWSGKTVVTGIPVLQAAGGRWWLSVGATVSTSHDGGLHFATHALPMPADAIGIA